MLAKLAANSPSELQTAMLSLPISTFLPYNLRHSNSKVKRLCVSQILHYNGKVSVCC